MGKLKVSRFHVVLVLFALVISSFMGCLGPAALSPSGENRPPTKPSVRAPSNGDEDVSVTPTLSWECTDPDGDSIFYSVYFGTEEGDLKPLGNNPSSKQHRITEPLKANTTYYWKVVATDGKGIVESGVWNFKTTRLEVIKKKSHGVLSSLDSWVTSPAVGLDGYIYIGSNQGLAKFSKDCELIEVISPGNPGFSAADSPTIDPQTGKVYFVDSGGYLSIYDKGGIVSVYTQGTPSVSPVVFEDHVYLFLGHSVFKMSKENLSLKGDLELSIGWVITNPVVVSGKFVAIGSVSVDQKLICGVDTSNLTISWERDPQLDYFPRSIAVDKDGRFYVVGRRSGVGTSLLCLDSTNEDLLWSFPLDGFHSGGPVVSKDGVIYLGVWRESGSYRGKIYAIDSSGKEKWSMEVEKTITATFVLGDNNVLYIVSRDTLMALRATDGEIIDTLALDSSVRSSPVLSNGEIFLVDISGKLYKIKALSDGLDDPSQAWPMFQKDQYHTGVR